MCLGKKKKKKLIVFVSERHFEEKAENQKRQRTHVCQAEHPETPSVNTPSLILNQQQGNFGCVSQPKSTNSEEAQCQCVIHLNMVKLKAVYCAQRPFILLNVSLVLANLSVRASTCQDERGGEKLGLSEAGFYSVSLQSACSYLATSTQ